MPAHAVLAAVIVAAHPAAAPATIEAFKATAEIVKAVAPIVDRLQRAALSPAQLILPPYPLPRYPAPRVRTERRIVRR